MGRRGGNKTIVLGLIYIRKKVKQLAPFLLLYKKKGKIKGLPVCPCCLFAACCLLSAACL